MSTGPNPRRDRNSVRNLVATGFERVENELNRMEKDFQGSLGELRRTVDELHEFIYKGNGVEPATVRLKSLEAEIKALHDRNNELRHRLAAADAEARDNAKDNKRIRWELLAAGLPGIFAAIVWLIPLVIRALNASPP